MHEKLQNEDVTIKKVVVVYSDGDTEDIDQGVIVSRDNVDNCPGMGFSTFNLQGIDRVMVLNGIIMAAEDMLEDEEPLDSEDDFDFSPPKNIEELFNNLINAFENSESSRGRK